MKKTLLLSLVVLGFAAVQAKADPTFSINFGHHDDHHYAPPVRHHEVVYERPQVYQSHEVVYQSPIVSHHQPAVVIGFGGHHDADYGHRVEHGGNYGHGGGHYVEGHGNQGHRDYGYSH